MGAFQNAPNILRMVRAGRVSQLLCTTLENVDITEASCKILQALLEVWLRNAWLLMRLPTVDASGTSLHHPRRHAK